MKKRILALITAAAMVLTMIPTMAFAESESDGREIVTINEENFPDNNFREYVMMEYSWDEGEPYVYKETLANDSYLYLEDYNIADLTGIEYFTGLKELDCSDNKLTTLDVSALTNLEYLDCRENQLTSLNVDGLTKLDDLYCGYNQLTKLDVSSSTEMDDLYCQHNQISTLILNSTAPYTWMNVSYNNLTNRDSIISNGNTNFGESEFGFHPQNWLKAVELNAANFPDPVLREELSDEYKDDNQDGILSPEEIIDITYLWLNGTMVEDLTGIEYLIALTDLDAGYSYLSELPPLPENLTELNVAGNYLTSLPVLPDGLEYLNCNRNQLATMPKLPDSIETLYCAENKLTALPALPESLVYLECSGNELTTLPALPSTLETLWCVDNQLEKLPTLPVNLKSINCENNKLKSLPVLPDNLTSLSCYRNQLTSLPSLPAKLQGISAWDNEISGVVDLGNLKFLTTIDLSDNRITGVILNPMAKYEWISLYSNAMKSTADIKGRDDIVWDQGSFDFERQKTACELNGHKYVKKVSKASFGSSGQQHSECSVCEDWKDNTYVYYGYVKTPKNITKAYTGSVLAAPKFVVKTNTGKILKQGTDYTVKKVTSAKLKNVGKYKYKITLQGAKYKGFTYAYVTVNPKATVINKLTKPAKRQIKVTWQKRTAQVTGYQIRYSGKQSMAGAATVKVKSFKTNTKTIKNLKAKKKYWVQVRTYKNVNGKTYYSAWSAKKSITTK